MAPSDTAATDDTAPSDGLNLATCWEAVADAVPSALALRHGEMDRTWAEFEARSALLAGHLDAAGLRPDAKVAFYLYNGPEYVEGMFAAFKQRCVPVNVNYRYLTNELLYLLQNSDAEAVLFSAELADRLDAVRAEAPLVRTFVCVGATDEHPVPEWAVDYESALAAAAPAPRIERSADDLWFLYTGGTTGMPKGVMWPHRSLLGTAAATFAIVKLPLPTTPDDAADAARTFHELGKAVRMLPAAPLMHGTSAITAVAVLSHGGCITTLTGRSFDADELCATVERNRITQLTIVGDAFAKPMVAALQNADAEGRPYDLSSLKVIASSGVMWSQQAKDQVLGYCSATLADLLGSSEGVGFGASVSKKGATEQTARFRLGEHAKVFTEEGVEVEPGSGTTGVLAVGGPIPVGYYKDPEKTAGTFRTFAGRVWSVPGDFATVEADGTIRLLGRGSVCINTAGEKVYPEEVEETLKLHVAVVDSNVVGLPDEKWGQAITALVSLTDGSTGSADLEAELVAHCKDQLAGYKCPKRVLFVPQILRGPNGKADYKWANATAVGLVGE